MTISWVRHELTSPTFYWALVVLCGTAAAFETLLLWADYQPQEASWIWVIGALFAGLSALLGLAPPFVVRAQVQFENDRSAENFPHVPIVFEEARLVPGCLSEVISRHRDAGSLP
jgi:hypothetical protein